MKIMEDGVRDHQSVSQGASVSGNLCAIAGVIALSRSNVSNWHNFQFDYIKSVS